MRVRRTCAAAIASALLTLGGCTTAPVAVGPDLSRATPSSAGPVRLAVRFTDGPGDVFVIRWWRRQVTYEVEVANLGPADASKVPLTVTITGSVRLPLTVEPTRGGACLQIVHGTARTGRVSCEFPIIRPGATATVRLTADVVTGDGSVVTASVPDPVPDEHSARRAATISTSIKAPPRLINPFWNPLFGSQGLMF